MPLVQTLCPGGYSPVIRLAREGIQTGCRDVAGESRAFGGQLVQVRRANVLIAAAPQAVIALLVGVKNEYIFVLHFFPLLFFFFFFFFFFF